MGNLIKEDLDVPCDYQYLVVFLKQVPESASLKYHIGWVSSLFVFPDGLKKTKKKIKTNQPKNPST